MTAAASADYAIHGHIVTAWYDDSNRTAHYRHVSAGGALVLLGMAGFARIGGNALARS